MANKGLVSVKKLRTILFSTLITLTGVTTHAADISSGQAEAKPNTVSDLTEAQVVAELEALGAVIQREGNAPGAPVVEVIFPNVHCPPYQATDVTIEHLKVFTHLKRLSLDMCLSVTDTGIKSLRELPELEYLSLSFLPLTDAGMTNLAGLTNLRRLSLAGTQVTDAGMASLEHMKKLQSLFIPDLIKVSDAGLAHLKELTELRTLNVYNTKLTDAGLENFRAMRSLKYLRIGGTKVTDKGQAEFKKALPGCALAN